MKKITILSVILFFTATVFSQTEWKMAGNKISTPWASKVDPANTLPEYPRPQMVRNNWMNLNGLWQYAILPKQQETIPASYAGKILVPIAFERWLFFGQFVC